MRTVRSGPSDLVTPHQETLSFAVCLRFTDFTCKNWKTAGHYTIKKIAGL